MTQDQAKSHLRKWFFLYLFFLTFLFSCTSEKKFPSIDIGNKTDAGLGKHIPMNASILVKSDKGEFSGKDFLTLFSNSSANIRNLDFIATFGLSNNGYYWLGVMSASNTNVQYFIISPVNTWDYSWWIPEPSGRGDSYNVSNNGIYKVQ